MDVPSSMRLPLELRAVSEIFVQTHFMLRKLHYWHGSVLANGVSFYSGESNGGGWFWWWNWRAFLCMALALALVSVATLGTIKGQQYVSKDTLWLPSNVPVLADKHHYESLFGSMDIARIVLTANAGYDTNMMHRGLFTSLWRLHTYIADELTVTVNGKDYSFDDVCVPVTLLGTTGCYQLNPLAFWPSGDGPGSFQRPSNNVGAAINDPASLLFNPWTRVDDIFGGVTRSEGKIVAIEALQLHYFFDSSPQRHANNSDWAQVLQSFESALLSTLKRYTFAEIAPNINLSYNKEIYSTMIADWPYLGASVCIILVILGLGFLSMDFVHHSRVFLGVSAVMTIIFAITSTQGAASVLFLSETVFDTFAVFLVTIIGLNHLYILIHTYDRVIDKELMRPDPQLQKGTVNTSGQVFRGAEATFRLYVTETLAEAMPSITAVYLIGIPAFGIGILSEFCFQYQPIPGLVSMSATCGFGLFLLYVILNLFFVPALVLDALRVVENRTDVLCLKREPEKPIRYTPVIGDIEVAPELALPPPPPYERLCHVLFRKVIGPVMTKLPIKIAVISLIILVVGLSVFVTANNQFALLPHPRQENLPSDNYLATYYGVQDQFFSSKVGIPLSLVITGANYTSKSTYATINSFLQKVDDATCIREGSVANWYKDYVGYLASKGLNITNFYLPLNFNNNTNIAVWLDSPSGGRYAKNLILHPNGTVKAATFTFNMVPLPASAREETLKCAHSLRDLVKSDEPIQELSDVPAIIYSEEFLYIDEAWILTKAMSAKIIVYLVLFLLLGLLFLDARSVVLIVLGTACVASLIYGILMYYLNMNISVYSISCLMMLAMVSFDYHFQIAYYWMRDKGPRTTRLMNVVTNIGTSLCCAFFTQFFGMMVLMFSLSSPINRAFAYLYVSITSFSFVLSVLVLPIILSWVGLRRQRVVIHSRYKSVLGGLIWDGHSEQDEDGDNYWSSDEDSSFYDSDRDRKDAGGPSDHSEGEQDGDSHLKLDDSGQRRRFERYEDSADEDERARRGSAHGRKPSRNASAASTDEAGVSTSSAAPAEVIARSLAGGGHEVTLEQLFVMAEQTRDTPDTQALMTSSGYAPGLRRSADGQVDGGGGGGGGSMRAVLAESMHKRTASGLRDLFFGSSALGGSSNAINTTTPDEGLHSFPSPSPTLLNASIGGRWSRESSWLASSTSRGGSKYYE